MARKFFYICAGLFMLALSYHLGASTASAQSPGNPVAAVIGAPGFDTLMFTANGDVYRTDNSRSPAPWTFVQNIFSGGPTPTSQQSWGQLKSRYAPAPSVSKTPADR